MTDQEFPDPKYPDPKGVKAALLVRRFQAQTRCWAITSHAGKYEEAEKWDKWMVEYKAEILRRLGVQE